MNLIPAPLFRNITQKELEEIQTLGCMRQRRCGKGSVLFHMGDLTCQMGVLLSGNILIETVDFWGNKSILQRVSSGQLFAETYALCREPLMVDVVCAEEAEVLLIDISTLLREENRQKTWYAKLERNLLMEALQKNLALSSRIFCTGPKTIRGRLVTYFSFQSARAGSMEFTIPFDRQQLADYLNLERSALSKELGKMKREGWLDFRKNHFWIKRPFPTEVQTAEAGADPPKR